MSEWRDQQPPERAWRAALGRTRAERSAEQDLAAGGREHRRVPTSGGRGSLPSVELKMLPRSRRVYAYLRWSDAGKTINRYIGEVGNDDRADNLAEAWSTVAAAGIQSFIAEQVVPAVRERSAGASWASSPAVRSVMKGNKGRDTRPELAVRSALYGSGMRYRINFRPLKELRRTADIAFTKSKVAVFIDGCFWHGCPEHHRAARTNADYWDSKVAVNRDRDADTDQRLAAAGWTVIRAWEHEDPESVADRVIATVRALA